MKYLLLIPVIVCIVSCQKRAGVDEPDFDVTVEKTTWKAKDTIVFKFTGTANVITFYSGEPGKEYKNRERFTVDGKAQLQFTSYQQNVGQPNTLQLMASTDYKNVLDAESVNEATWTDITSRATLSTGADNTASGVVDLSDFQKGDTSMFLAFRFTGKKLATTQPTWTIKNVSVDNKLADGSLVNIGNIGNLSWAQLDMLNTARFWSFTATQLQIAGGPANTDDNNDWIISKPLQLNRIQRALGVSVRSNPTSKQTSYIFPGFATPGTYTVTFEAINANRWDKKMTVKEFTITVQ